MDIIIIFFSFLASKLSHKKIVELKGEERNEQEKNRMKRVKEKMKEEEKRSSIERFLSIEHKNNYENDDKYYPIDKCTIMVVAKNGTIKPTATIPITIGLEKSTYFFTEDTLHGRACARCKCLVPPMLTCKADFHCTGEK